MIRLIGKRASLLLVALTLIGAAFVVLSPRTAAQGGFQYMCDAWEQSCDDGSGGNLGDGGGSGGGGGGYYCKANEWCGNFGCHDKSYVDHTQVCNLYKIGDGPGTCPSQINCTKAP
jgi:hypothetical protein